MQNLKYEVEIKFNQDILTIHNKKIVLGLTSIPEKGKANRELIKKLAKHFKVHSSQINIISGFKSKKKIVEINQGE